MRKDKNGCTVCNTRENVAAKKTIELEMARLDAKLETTAPENFLWGDYDALRAGMRVAAHEVVMSKDFCEFTQRHKHILSRLIKSPMTLKEFSDETG